jgi:hypothetical protein
VHINKIPDAHPAIYRGMATGMNKGSFQRECGRRNAINRNMISVSE